VLKIHDLHVYYGGIHALEGISLEVPANKIITLIGANGAGKSTTLRTICGLVRAAAGTITFNGVDITRASTTQIVQMGITMVPEGRRVFPDLTVLENLYLGGYTRKDSEVKRDLDWVFSLFPRLKERKGQLAGTLSGGEQQMLAVGRALMANPTLLMMDEPPLGWPPSWSRRSSESSRRSTVKGRLFSSLSRMPGPPSSWPITAMSWKRAELSSPAPARSSWPGMKCARFIWAKNKGEPPGSLF